MEKDTLKAGINTTEMLNAKRSELESIREKFSNDSKKVDGGTILAGLNRAINVIDDVIAQIDEKLAVLSSLDDGFVNPIN